MVRHGQIGFAPLPTENRPMSDLRQYSVWWISDSQKVEPETRRAVAALFSASIWTAQKMGKLQKAEGWSLPIF